MRRRMCYWSSTRRGADIARRMYTLLPLLTKALRLIDNSLAPKYEDLARLYSSTSSQITIAKVDATANDVPDEIQGFPTIKLYPANNKEPVNYEGSRTVEDLAAFIRDNGSHKIDVSSSVEEMQSSAASAATEEMQHQAPAATKVAEKVVEGVKETVEKVVEAATGGGDDVDDHDEL